MTNHKIDCLFCKATMHIKCECNDNFKEGFEACLAMVINIIENTDKDGHTFKELILEEAEHYRKDE